mmetsp:Transcript_59084/g.128265  ORF Transcript_59084/g.128265 Transcript_59084/m.128265 type:complete len:537 (-) Transcript_59084:623-2233(-)
MVGDSLQQLFEATRQLRFIGVAQLGRRLSLQIGVCLAVLLALLAGGLVRQAVAREAALAQRDGDDARAVTDDDGARDARAAGRAVAQHLLLLLRRQLREVAAQPRQRVVHARCDEAARRLDRLGSRVRDVVLVGQRRQLATERGAAAVEQPGERGVARVEGQLCRRPPALGPAGTVSLGPEQAEADLRVAAEGGVAERGAVDVLPEHALRAPVAQVVEYFKAEKLSDRIGLVGHLWLVDACELLRVLQQRVDHRVVVDERGDAERRLAVAVGGGDVGAAERDELLDHLGPAREHGRLVQRRVAEDVSGVDELRRRVEQKGDSAFAPTLRGDVERGRPGRVDREQIGPALSKHREHLTARPIGAGRRLVHELRTDLPADHEVARLKRALEVGTRLARKLCRHLEVARGDGVAQRRPARIAPGVALQLIRVQEALDGPLLHKVLGQQVGSKAVEELRAQRLVEPILEEVAFAQQPLKLVLKASSQRGRDSWLLAQHRASVGCTVTMRTAWVLAAAHRQQATQRIENGECANIAGASDD